MKITRNIECLAEEVRRFLGFSDVAPMQEEWLQYYRDHMRERIEKHDPDALLKSWISATVGGWEVMQKTVWSQLAGITSTE